MKKYRIGIWGQSGGGGKIADGQAVRTTVILQELQSRYGEDEILFVDTFNWKKRTIVFLKECIKLISVSENVIVMPADNGFKIFVPIMMLLNLIFKKKLIYIVIGGFLPALLKKKPMYIKLVNRFNILFVQTQNLKKDLEKIGINNVHILSNLKRLNTRKPDQLVLNTDKNIKVCVFSRINKEKGIEDAIEAVKRANEKLGNQCITLDFYGLLPDSYRDTFNKLLEENKGLIEYKGIVSFNKTVETLQQYFALLFPTYYYGEGFPGNLVDAYNTGIPIIATNWLYNADIIKDGINGILVPIKKPEEICNALLKLYFDRNYAMVISLNNLEEAKKYQPEKVMKELYTFIDTY